MKFTESLEETDWEKLSKNPNPRAHLVLFQTNTPFRPKRVESKVQYRRKPKHQEQRYE